jgi:hypothetical protein
MYVCTVQDQPVLCIQTCTPRPLHTITLTTVTPTTVAASNNSYSLVRQVGDSANTSFEARAVYITRHRHNYLNIVCYTPTLKLALCFHHVLYARVAVRLYYSLLHCKQCVRTVTAGIVMWRACVSRVHNASIKRKVSCYVQQRRTAVPQRLVVHMQASS